MRISPKLLDLQNLLSGRECHGVSRGSFASLTRAKMGDSVSLPSSFDR
jgi:hypothetical protein